MHPCRMEQIDSVKFNPSLVMMRECCFLGSGLTDLTDTATRACSDPELTDITTAAPLVRELIGEDLLQVGFGDTRIFSSFVFVLELVFCQIFSFAVTRVTGNGGNRC